MTLKGKIFAWGLAALTAIGLLELKARADYDITVGSGTTVFAFTCFTSKVCPAHTIVNSAGTEIFTAAAGGVVVGNVADNGVDAGAPVKVGAKYNSGTQTYADGDRADLQADVNGNLKVNVQSAVGLAQGSTTSGQTGSMVMGAVTTNAPSYTTAQTSPLSLDTSGRQRVTMAPDPCQYTSWTRANISMTSATTTRIIAPSASNKVYVCHLFLNSLIANGVLFIEGTGGTCGTGTAAIIGGTSATQGFNIGATGGLQMTSGGRSVAVTAGTNVDVCLTTSAVGPLAGTISYVLAP